MERAKSSLPVPLSPRRRMLASELAARRADSMMVLIFGLSPTMVAYRFYTSD